MSELFIDITELEGWQGKLTGVPRVMDEVSKRFAQTDTVAFVSWGPSGYSLCEYPLTAITSESSSNKTVGAHIRYAKAIYSRSRTVRKAVSKVRSRRVHKTAFNQPNTVTINPGDTLFVLADWHGGDPSFVHYLVEAKEKGVVLAQIVYDLLPIVTPQYSGHSTDMLSNYSKKIYPLCDVLFSISEHTKSDVTKWLKDNGLKTPPIQVIRLGDDFSSTNATKPKAKLPSNYILCVGTIEARKNHTLLYYVYKLAFKRGIALPPAVIVGRVGWLAEDTYKIMTTDPEVKDKFTFMHSVDDNQLAWLYQNCMFSVYPSFYEGWGLPIAEGIGYGKVVVASNTSSMPEVAGDLIPYFSPASTEECLEAIVKLGNKDNLKQAEKQIASYKPYSWDATYGIINREINKLS